MAVRMRKVLARPWIGVRVCHLLLLFFLFVLFCLFVFFFTLGTIFLQNRPFPSSLVPLFHSESKCKTILMKMTLICVKMKLHAELIFV